MENLGTTNPQKKSLERPERFEFMENQAVFRPTGRFTLENAVRSVTLAIAFARERQIRKLLLDVTGIFGFEKPTLSERYFLVREWAVAAQGRVCLAVITKPEWEYYEDIDVIAAENIGLRAKVFLLEKEALAWLQAVSCVDDKGRFVFTRG